jgi:ribosomal protein L7/L12
MTTEAITENLLDAEMTTAARGIIVEVVAVVDMATDKTTTSKAAISEAVMAGTYVDSSRVDGARMVIIADSCMKKIRIAGEVRAVLGASLKNQH